MERLPLQEQIDGLKEDTDSQWEMMCSMIRGHERVMDVLMKDLLAAVEVMKQFSETQRGLVKYIASKQEHSGRRNYNNDKPF